MTATESPTVLWLMPLRSRERGAPVRRTARLYPTLRRGTRAAARDNQDSSVSAVPALLLTWVALVAFALGTSCLEGPAGVKEADAAAAVWEATLAEYNTLRVEAGDVRRSDATAERFAELEHRVVERGIVLLTKRVQEDAGSSPCVEAIRTYVGALGVLLRVIDRWEAVYRGVDSEESVLEAEASYLNYNDVAAFAREEHAACGR